MVKTTLFTIIYMLSFLSPGSLFASCEKTSKKQFFEYLERNKVERIVFFATWCHSCLPKLRSLGESDVVFLAFDDKENGDSSLEKLKISNRCFYGKSILEHYNVKSLPYEINLTK